MKEEIKCLKKTGIILALSLASTSLMAVEYMDAAWAQ